MKNHLISNFKICFWSFIWSQRFFLGLFSAVVHGFLVLWSMAGEWQNRKYILQIPPPIPSSKDSWKRHFPGWWSLVSICTMPARALAEEMAEHGSAGTLGADVPTWKERGVINEFTVALRLFARTVRHKDAARWHNNDWGCWWWAASRIPNERRSNFKSRIMLTNPWRSVYSVSDLMRL